MAPATAPKQVVRVTIFQQSYALRASADPAETEAVARGVDELMHQIADRTHTGDGARVAVLAALHLADKHRQAEQRADAAEDRLHDFRVQLQETQRALESAQRRVKELETAIEQKQAAGTSEREHASELMDRLAALDERLSALLETPEDTPPF